MGRFPHFPVLSYLTQSDECKSRSPLSFFFPPCFFVSLPSTQTRSHFITPRCYSQGSRNEKWSWYAWDTQTKGRKRRRSFRPTVWEKAAISSYSREISDKSRLIRVNLRRMQRDKKYITLVLIETALNCSICRAYGRDFFCFQQVLRGIIHPLSFIQRPSLEYVHHACSYTQQILICQQSTSKTVIWTPEKNSLDREISSSFTSQV